MMWEFCGSIVNAAGSAVGEDVKNIFYGNPYDFDLREGGMNGEVGVCSRWVWIRSMGIYGCNIGESLIKEEWTPISRKKKILKYAWIREIIGDKVFTYYDVPSRVLKKKKMLGVNVLMETDVVVLWQLSGVSLIWRSYRASRGEELEHLGEWKAS